VLKREGSAFFRTSPGRYFLRDFLEDQGIPGEFRRPFYARRRLRELVRGPALAIMSGRVAELAGDGLTIDPAKVTRLLTRGLHSYVNPKQKTDGFFVVRPFVCVFKGSRVLTYRVGRYRDDRDSFLSKRSIGFSTLVAPHDHTLFTRRDVGILHAGVRATMLDLDMTTNGDGYDQLAKKAVLHRFVLAQAENGSCDLLAVVSLKCPAWFEPFRRRLALNDLEWMELRNRINNIDDFDPWSRAVLKAYYAKSRVFGTQLDS
jgi:hypothetical protein